MGRGRWPALDTAETKNELVVKAEIPGCKAEDIDISVHGNTLTISGEKKEEQEEKKKGYYRVERSYGTFRRDLTLGSDIDTRNDTGLHAASLRAMPLRERGAAERANLVVVLFLKWSTSSQNIV